MSTFRTSKLEIQRNLMQVKIINKEDLNTLKEAIRFFFF
jgi:hypothetical protein